MISAADQARFFFEMETLIPHEFVGGARSLLSKIADYESWGIPAIARPLGHHGSSSKAAGVPAPTSTWCTRSP